MWFVILGVVLLVLKLAGVGIAEQWSWWLVVSPFGLAVVWWAVADATGITQRRASRRMEEKREARRERNLVAMGLSAYRDRRTRKIQETRRTQATTEPGRDSTSSKSGPDTR